MTETCKCQSCNAEFGFDAHDFQQSNRIGNMIFGQTVQCPHCNQDTSVYKVVEDEPQKLQPIKDYYLRPVPQSEPHENPMLAPCGACGKPVSKTARVCPNCGHTGTPAGLGTILVRIIVYVIILAAIGWVLSLIDY